MPDPTIPNDEYAARRKRLRTKLKDAVGVLHAGDLADHLHDDFRPHPHFEYLTGLTDEPGAVLVLDPANPVEARRDMLFLRPLNPEMEKWDGFRAEIGSALRAQAGINSVFRTTHLPRFLTTAAQRSCVLACLHPIATYEQALSPDLAMFRKIAERQPGATITDRSEEIPRLRSIKSRAEVAMIQRAVDITGKGFEAAFAAMRPGASEFDVQEALEHAYRTNGSRGPAFGTIVGAGFNSTVLHYRANCETINDGDIVCIDSGAAYRGYGGDITRTVPANGTFSPRQREVYDVVLKALVTATKAVKPGVRMSRLDQIARAVITKAGFGDFFIHSIGHHLGLETHDAAPDEPLKAGAVVTIEPGVYIPDEKIGVRIEDDVLVTKEGHRVLSAKIPRTAAAIEKVVRGK